MLNNPLTWGISGWDVGKQLTQRAQGFILPLLLTLCYGTGQTVLSASVSPSVKQRSKLSDLPKGWSCEPEVPGER